MGSSDFHSKWLSVNVEKAERQVWRFCFFRVTRHVDVAATQTKATGW
jgi:hypothetical protein